MYRGWLWGEGKDRERGGGGLMHLKYLIVRYSDIIDL